MTAVEHKVQGTARILPQVLARAYHLASLDPLCVVMRKGMYLVETPLRRCDAEATRLLQVGKFPPEAVLRVFVQYEDALLYAEMQKEVLMEQGLRVVECPLPKLFDYLPILREAARARRLRVDLCRMLPNDYPEVLDTLVDDFATIH